MLRLFRSLSTGWLVRPQLFVSSIFHKILVERILQKSYTRCTDRYCEMQRCNQMRFVCYEFLDFFDVFRRDAFRLAAGLFLVVFFFFGGTFAPFSRASDNPMATACFRLVTFFPVPVRNVPCFFFFMARSTISPDFFEYFAIIFFEKG